MLDLKIINGTIVDGTGSTGRPATLGVRDGRIVLIGDSDEAAMETIDAAGLIVAPGFIDVHTHYDAQALWDPTLSPSSFHGITTVFGGFCGFSIAPLTAEASGYLMAMLARVEGMPLESLQAGVPWDWTTFAQYLDRIDGRIAINAGFFCGHSALRRQVMGERAVGGKATGAEIERMKQLLRASIEGGALGFSTSLSPTHGDADGEPVPSRHASIEEILDLFSVVSEFEGAMAEMAPPEFEFTEMSYDIMTRASLAARRPINWNLLTSSGSSEDEQARVARQLHASVHAEERGARVVALALPQTPRVRINMVNGVLFDTIPGWKALFRLPLAERMAALRDPEMLETLRAGAESVRGTLADISNFADMQVSETFSAATAPYRGRLIGDIAREEGRSPFATFVAIVLADDLRTSVTIGFRPDTQDMFVERAKQWTSPHTIIGGGDAGAHLDMIDTFAVPTELLGTGVRERKVIALEEAVHLITLKPAQFMGLKHRGRIAEGWFADLVIFDPDTIAAGETHTRSDLPGEGMRLYAEAIGIDRVIVNGQVVIAQGDYTGATAGTVLRPGSSTETVAIPADLPASV